MENPYQSPESLPGYAAASSGGGMARQIPVVAILLMVQGGLEMLMGGILALFGSTFAFFMVQQQGQGGANVPPGPPFGLLMVAVYAVMGIGAFAVAALKLFAGWQNYFFRGRTWGIAALASGVVSIVTCYCFPTALILMVYGLIVYLSAEAGWAFSLGDQRFTREQVLWHLQRDTSL
ncbi:MAG TPA: hypothetical protein VG125_09720 [Pirellulales bacterium]|nr:hypothetical protein [Pirellulales bacterium]